MKRNLKATVFLADKDFSPTRLTGDLADWKTGAEVGQPLPIALVVADYHDLLPIAMSTDRGEASAAALKDNGVLALIASAIPPLFYRALVNVGIVPAECDVVTAGLKNHEEIEIDFTKNEMVCRAGNFRIQPIPDPIGKIIESGGLLNHARRILGK